MNQARKTQFLVVALAILAGWSTLAAAQRRTLTPEEQAEREQRFQAELVAPRPVEALDSIWIEELTWVEIRDAIAAGKTSVLVPTGGIEQNGPYVAMGKHNYILQTVCEDIARELGNALCAPIVKLVPEGNIDEPSGHMRYSGTISVQNETFEAVLEDVGRSLKVHGFENIIYIGDSGGNQRGQEAVAERLNTRWTGARAHHIAGFYDNNGLIKYMNDELGIVEPSSDGVHDSYWITALQMVTDPSTVRYEQRVSANKAMVNGVSIADLDKTVAVGKKLMQWRVDKTVALIRESIGAGTSSQQ